MGVTSLGSPMKGWKLPSDPKYLDEPVTLVELDDQSDRVDRLTERYKIFTIRSREKDPSVSAVDVTAALRHWTKRTSI